MNKVLIKKLIDLPANDYWRLVNKEKIPTQRALEHFEEGLVKEDFISKSCAHNYRRVKNCTECIKFYQCLDLGKSIVFVHKKDD